MKLTLFYVAFAFLVATLVFHILGVSTNSWWKSGYQRPGSKRSGYERSGYERSGQEILFVAGLWKVCLQGSIDASCVDYMRLFDVRIRGVPIYRVIGGLPEGSRKQLNILRTCVLLFIVLLLSLLLVSILILCFICRGSKIVFPRWLKLSLVLGQACSVCVGFACVIIPTKHDKIFQNPNIQLKMSWMCILLSNFFNIFAAITLVVMFVDDVSTNKISRQPMKFTPSKEMVHEPVGLATKEKQILRSESEMNEELEWDELEWRIEQYSSKVPVHHDPTLIEDTQGPGPDMGPTEGPRPELSMESHFSEFIEDSSVEILEFVETTMFSETTRVAETIIINEPRNVVRESAKLANPTVLGEMVTIEAAKNMDAKKVGGPKKLIPPPDILGEPGTPGERNSLCKSNTPGESNIPGEPNISDELNISDAPVIFHDSLSRFSETRKPKVRRKVPLIADLSMFTEIDLGRLQCESFRNKSTRVKSSSFANRVPYYASIKENSRMNT